MAWPGGAIRDVSLAGLAVDELARDVQLADVARVLLEEVEEDSAQ
jgi:hypothetical protein